MVSEGGNERCVGFNVNLCVGLARTIHIYGVYTVFLAGKSSNIRSYTVYIYIQFWPTLPM